MTDAAAIAAKLTPRMKQAIMALSRTKEWQQYPAFKGSAASSLCYVKQRPIAPDCYAVLGRSRVESNKNRRRRSDPIWLEWWQFTPLGLAVRAILEQQP